MSMMSANHADFYYELHGSGQPIILISGYTCDHLNFASILDSLSQRFQVLILDNRGIGQTKDDSVPLSVELMARDVMALANALDLKKPHIVGHSMGGTIAQSIAIQFPDAISNLVLLATAAKWRTAMLDALASLLLLRQKDTDFDTIFSCLLPWIFDEKFLSNPEKVLWFKHALLSNPHPQSLADQERQFQVLKHWDGRNQLQHIKAPTLVGYGIQDLISLPQDAFYLANNISGAKLVEFDCAHDFSLSVPKELAKAIMEFCS